MVVTTILISILKNKNLIPQNFILPNIFILRKQKCFGKITQKLCSIIKQIYFIVSYGIQFNYTVGLFQPSLIHFLIHFIGPHFLTHIIYFIIAL